MCGLLGVVRTRCDDADERAIVEGLAALDHRGPDARIIRNFANGGRGCTLGHTRLRIIDLSPEGDQPLPNEEASVWVAYNGELYNHPELRAELERHEHRYRSLTDTEDLVHLYERMRGDVPSMLGRLRGMFAFALWDETRGRLILARDRLGIKPLYWTDVSGGVAFASEIRALVRAGFAADHIDEDDLGRYLVWGRVRGARTIFSDVVELPPGSWLEWSGGAPVVRAWARPDVEPDTNVAADAERFLRAALDDSVERHLVADRSVGVFLSGGIDSGAVAALAANRGASRMFTVAFPETGDDEAASAAGLARQLGAQHDRVPVTGAEVASMFPDILRSMDQPTSDGVNTWVVCRAAHDAGLVVALSGVGGDELFGGYPSFRLVPLVERAARAASVLPSNIRIRVARDLARFVPDDRMARVLTASKGSEGAYAAVRELRAPVLLRSAGVCVPSDADAVTSVDGCHPADRVTMLELRNYLPDQLLRDTDQMSMAHSLEVRVPLLDDNVVRTALALPAAVRAEEGKRLLARAARVPPTAKRPFALPFERWLRGPLRDPVRDALLSDELPFANELPGGFRRGVWEAFERGRTHWSRPWSIAVLRRWPVENGIRI
jgi:asparagine synthase (glutamine-hydrolysing)